MDVWEADWRLRDLGGRRLESGLGKVLNSPLQISCYPAPNLPWGKGRGCSGWVTIIPRNGCNTRPLEGTKTDILLQLTTRTLSISVDQAGTTEPFTCPLSYMD